MNVPCPLFLTPDAAISSPQIIAVIMR